MNKNLSTPYHEQLDLYLRELRNNAVMSHEETLQCLAKWKDYGDRRAYEQIMYCNHKLILKIAFRHVGRGLPIEDMLQEGFFGLSAAIEKFKPELGYRFSTYASWWIRQSITCAIINQGDRLPYRQPVHVDEMIKFISKAVETFSKKYGRQPSDQESYDWIKSSASIDKKTNLSRDITIDEVIECRRLMAREHCSLDFASDKADRSIHETVGDVRVDIETAAGASEMLKEYEATLARIEAEVDKLDTRSAMVLRLRLGLNEFDAMTLEDVSERYELTRERIRQIAADALERLDAALGTSKGEIEQIVAVTDELRTIVSALPKEKTTITRHQPLPLSVSLDNLFHLLCEHVLLTPVNRRVVKAPLATLQVRGCLIYGEALTALEQLQERGLIVCDSHWTEAEIIPKVAIPKFSAYSSRGPISSENVPDDISVKAQVDGASPSPQALTPRALTLRPRPAHQGRVERPVTIVRRRSGGVANRLTYGKVWDALTARASVVAGERIIRGVIPLLKLSLKIGESDAIDVLKKFQERGYILPKDGWRVIALGQDCVNRDELALAVETPVAVTEPERVAKLILAQAEMPADKTIMSSSRHAVLDTAISWIERQLPQLRQSLGEAHSRLKKLEQALSVLKQARDGHEQTAVAVNQAIAEMEAAMQEFFVLLRQGNSA